MLTADDYQRLGRLLNALHQCLDIKFALMNREAREVYTASYQTAFCRAIAATQGGCERCVQCDCVALRDIRSTQKMKKYYCHAGLIEIALPVTESGEIIATILFGQVLDDSPREAQWERVRRACGWYPDMEALYQYFLRLKRVSSQQISAITEIVHACVSEVRLSGIAATSNQDDMQRLLNYLDTHYSAQVSVDDVCQAMSMGKTRLYQLCKTRLSKPVVQLLNERRLEAAKELLTTTGHTIQFIADTVGIPDFNYFAKLFRRYEGVTPSAYRKQTSHA
jgi:AraC-like DNA-binding protein